MSDENKKGIEANPDSGKTIYDETTGVVTRPDKRKMYKDWFMQAKNNAVEAGFVQSSLITLDEIRGIKPSPKDTKKKTKKIIKNKRK